MVVIREILTRIINIEQLLVNTSPASCNHIDPPIYTVTNGYGINKISTPLCSDTYSVVGKSI